MDGSNAELEARLRKKEEEAKKLAVADIKLILLGDSAVGKSK